MSLQIKEFRRKTLEDLANRIAAFAVKQEGYRFDELKMWNIVCGKGNKPITDENGLYWLSDKQDLLYIGKSTSRSLVDRIGGHYSAGKHHWLNHILKLSDAAAEPFISSKVYKEISRCRWGFLHIFNNAESNDYNGKDIQPAVGVLERWLRWRLQPRLNPEKRQPKLTGEELLEDLLSQLWRG